LITMIPSAWYLLATPAIPPPIVDPGIFVGMPPGRGVVSRFWSIPAAAFDMLGGPFGEAPGKAGCPIPGAPVAGCPGWPDCDGSCCDGSG